MKLNKPSSAHKSAAKASVTPAARVSKPAASTKSDLVRKAAAKPEPPRKAPAPAPAPTPAPAKRQARAAAANGAKKAPLQVPSILLEGDQTPAAAAVSGPGQRYALGATPPAEHFPAAEGELPEAYGTMQLFLTARDPHWLYAAWDLSNAQLKKHNALSTDGHLVLRIYKDGFGGPPLSQIHVHPESRNWFVPVPEAGAKYLAELGYYGAKAKWVEISKSGATLTPPDSLSEDMSVRFATISPDVPFADLLALVKSAVREHVPLVEALEQLRAEGFKDLPGASEIQSGKWTAAQEKALGRVVSMDQIRRIWIGSLEITELVRRQLEVGISSMMGSMAGAVFSLPSSPFGAISSISSVSSPFGGIGRRKGFWFNVNAELIIYGATEPDAKVTIGNRPIKLRPDGSFSFRFSLPDGQYSLPAVATSADGEDSRSAGLKFSRATDFSGEVGKHPQDAALRPPVVTSVS